MNLNEGEELIAVARASESDDDEDVAVDAATAKE
jgi:hypothetical protein